MTVAERFAETHEIRRALFAMAGDRPRTAPAMFDELCREWGDINERRLWRVAHWLLKNGMWIRVGDRYHSEGYIRGPRHRVSRSPLMRTMCSRAQEEACSS